MTSCFFRFSILVLGLLSHSLAAQTIKLDNPSFEDFPQASHTPQGWYDCGFAGESPPDVQPNTQFQVTKAAKAGKTYLGLVVRDNNTWEAVGQRLKVSLQKGKCYQFSLDLCKSELYVSKSKMTNKDVNYVTPAIVRIWAGNTYCAKDENLADSEPIESTQWKTYTFRFKPKADYNYIMIEAFYKMPTLFPYNGNVLIDAISDWVLLPSCDPTIASVEPKQPKSSKPPVKETVKKPVEKPKDTPTVKHTPAPIVATVEPPKPLEPKVESKPEPVVSPTNKRLKTGDVISIEKLQFKGNDFSIDHSSYSSLDKIYDMLSENPSAVVEIGGHTNSLPDDLTCDRLSTNRAKAVKDYLVNKGIHAERLYIKGYGKTKPIASNDTPEGRKLNQRVEVKILSING